MSAMEIKHPAITEDLRRKILSGSFGEKLPPLRTLMRKYHVSMQTISKAVKPLSGMGLIVPGPRGSVIVPAQKKRPRSFAIGVLWMNGPNYDEDARRIAMELQDYWAKKSYNVVFLNLHNPNLRNNPDFWRTLPVDGLLFAYGTLSAELAQAVHNAGIPALVPHFAENMPVHVMEYDTFPAVEHVVNMLRERGFRRIALQFNSELAGYQNVADARWDEIRGRHGIPGDLRKNVATGSGDTIERHTRSICRKEPPEFILCWHAYPERTLETLKSLGLEKKVRIVSMQDGPRLGRTNFRITPPPEMQSARDAFLERIISTQPKKFLHEYVSYLPEFIDDPPEIIGRDLKAEVTRK